jgi:hypothetical protein
VARTIRTGQEGWKGREEIPLWRTPVFHDLIVRAPAWLIGGLCAVVILFGKKVREGGIGPQTTRALTICLGIPFLITMAADKVLSGDALAALAGALLGLGIQKASDTAPK